MTTYEAGKYDVVVIGAGHAGVEAGLAAARLGKKTIMFTINLDSVAMMPCNPSIGGTGKGHLVREIDALGGEMGINTDKATIQSKMLNTAKGPAVHSLRVQADKTRYHIEMKKVIENTENLSLRQAEIVDILTEDGKVTGVMTSTGGIYHAKAVIIATGTYLAGKIFIGHSVTESGPNGLAPSKHLSSSLKRLGLDLRRFKTGTPARVNSNSLDYSKMIIQNGDKHAEPFSFMNDNIEFDEEPCYLTYTNESTHNLINLNIHLSAMYSGQIEGTGPRYCPSIEDKITRFADKDRHQLFIEPEGVETNEMYVQGMSTSLPENVQESFMRTIKGLENVEIMRTAYAIEYDCVDPTQLNLSLEVKNVSGLFSAGQFNGSSGYEEAAAQGLVAGINASRKIDGLEPMILDRSEAYIGVLIDDLVTKGTNEPFRMLTSRAEYRLILRQDNADVRLTEKGHDIGLARDVRIERLRDKLEKKSIEIERLKSTKIKAEVINELGTSAVKDSMSLYDLMRRPEISYDTLSPIDTERPEISRDVMNIVEVEIKYSGYIEKQLRQIDKFKSLENKMIPDGVDYSTIEGLRLEARQKLADRKPLNIGQASRISGVNPADISVLLVYLEQLRRKK